jgi:capsular exopolysaccharide synthesis family protein
MDSIRQEEPVLQHRVNGNEHPLLIHSPDRLGFRPAPEPAALAAPTESMLSLNAILSSFRRRWFSAVGLGLIAGALAAAAVWTLVPVRYTAFAELRMKEVADKVLFDTAEKQAAFRTYKQTQMRMATSPFVLSAALGKPEMANLKTFATKSDPVHWLENKLEVISPPGAGEFVRISLTGDEPAELAAIVNAVTQAYMEEVVNSEKLKRQKRKDDLEQIHRGIDEQLRTRRQSMRKLAQALETSNLEALTTKQQMAAEYFAQLRREHAQTRFERMRTESQLASETTGTAESANAEVPDILVDGRIDLEPEVLRLNERVRTLEDLIRRTRQNVNSENHPTLVQYRNELKDIEKQIVDTRKEIRPRIVAQIQSASAANAASGVAQLQKRLEVLKAQEQQLGEEIETQQVQTKKLGGDSFELELLQKEIDQRETMDGRVTEEIERLSIELQAPPRVVLHRPAEVPKLPVVAQKAKMTGLAGFGAFFAICGGILLFDLSARKINSADDVVGTLRVPILGYLPELPRSFKHNDDKPVRGRHLMLKNHWTESVDSTRTVLLHDTDQRSMKLIMVTSAISGEGKSTLSSQLAGSLARSGRTTLLVDADVRSPCLHRMFDVPLTPGLCELLRGEVEDHDVIRRTSQDGLFVVPAGQVTEEALRCMARDLTKPIFARFKSEFSFVVVDTSPVMLVVDPLLIGKHVDAAVFAVRRDLSRSTRTSAACQRLTALGIPVLGSVVIGVDQGSSGYGSHYGYGYYGYGSRNNHTEFKEAQT